MKRYTVTVQEIVIYSIDVDAECEATAKAEAEFVFTHASNLNEFFVCVGDRRAIGVNELVP
jgi:hypothetical protein